MKYNPKIHKQQILVFRAFVGPPDPEGPRVAAFSSPPLVYIQLIETQ